MCKDLSPIARNFHLCGKISIKTNREINKHLTQKKKKNKKEQKQKQKQTETENEIKTISKIFIGPIHLPIHFQGKRINKKQKTKDKR